MDILKFSFGHINVELSAQAVSNYEWLNNLFGNGKIGTQKNELDFNLNVYLKTVSRFKLRELSLRMLKLEDYYTNHVYNENINDEYTILLEKFLNEGPGFEGFEVLERDNYTCKKCGIKTLNKFNFEQKDLLPHDLVSVSSSIKCCKYCSKMFQYSAEELPQEICLRNACLHDWE